MTRAVVFDKAGGPEVMKIKDVPLPALKKGQVKITHSAIGLNYIDIYFRSGMMPAQTPAILGFEGVGYIDETKGDVGNFKKDDRVVYCTAPMGSYCDERVLDYKYLARVPDHVSDEQAAAMFLKGMTAHTLLRRTFYLQKNMWILIHSAAGGTGSYLCQLATYLGGRVIGTVGDDSKKKIAKANGCKKVINYNKENFKEAVMDFTKGKGVYAVFDGVGAKTFDKSLQCLMPFGLMVTYGQTSGIIPPISIHALTAKSLFLTRPSIFEYKKDRIEMTMTATDLFDLFAAGAIKDNITEKYKLDKVADAHKALESRKTTGSIVLIP